MRFSEVIAKAADNLTEETWGQYELKTEDDKYCFYGHIYLAAGAQFECDDIVPSSRMRLISLISLVEEWDDKGRTDKGYGENIVSINDAEGTIADDMKRHMKDLYTWAQDHDFEVPGEGVVQ